MPCIRKTVLVHHAAERMFDLVDGIEEYPNFLPWCSSVIIHARDEEILDATVQIEFMKAKTAFRTRDRRTPSSRIEMELVEGPFHKLEGHWEFIALQADACKVEFVLDYEFANKLLDTVVGPVFDRICRTLVDAFVHEADQRHP